MNAYFKNIFLDKTLYFGFILSFIFVLINLVYTLFSYNNLPPFLPIFNQMPWGEERIGIKTFIFLPTSLSFTIFISNLILASIIYKKVPLLSRILMGASLIVSFFTLLFIFRTIQIII